MTAARSLLLRVLASSLFVVPVAGGCYGTPDSFSRRASKLDCVRLRECERSVFDSEFDGDMGECREELEDFTNAAFDEAEAAGCEYDPDEGRDCIHEAYRKRKDCSSGADEAIAAACAEVLSCPEQREREGGDAPASVLESLQVVPGG